MRDNLKVVTALLLVATLLHSSLGIEPEMRVAKNSSLLVIHEGSANSSALIEATQSQRLLTKKSSRTTNQYRIALASADNYRDIVKEVHDAAYDGDPDAQYTLYKILDFCARDYQNYFYRDDQWLTLDEGLQNSLDHGIPNAIAKKTYKKCHDVAESRDVQTDLGSADQWLAKSAAAGYPIAQATKALSMLVNDRIKSDSPDLDSGNESHERDEAMELLQAAVQADDPEVFATMASVPTGKSSTIDEQQDNYLAWIMVACDHGMDCSKNADWVWRICQFDANCTSSQDGVGIVEQASDLSLYRVKERARQINSAISARDWVALVTPPVD